MTKRIAVRFLVVACSFTMIASAGCGGDDDDDNADARVIVDAPPVADAPSGTDAPPTPDAGPTPDADDTDAAPGASTQIEEARDAADGAVSITISGAFVTYLRPQVGGAPAGFFIQAVQVGPALLIEVDPATLSPAPVVGDEVELRVTEMDTYGTARMATAIADYSRLSQSNDLSGLVQDVTAATNLVSAVGNYESELITLDGTVVADFSGAGGGHMAAQIETTGVTGNADLELRVPQGLLEVVDIVNGCTFTLVNTPLGRFDSTAQPSAWRAPDISLTTCPAPQVVSAVAASSTSVVVTFDRHIDAGSVLANGSQFTFDNGLSASAASTSGKQVTLTTGAQTGGTTYTVTVANTVTDTLSTGVDAAHNTATFAGFAVLAVLRINELNANIDPNCDLVELRVMTGGVVTGIELYERTTSVLTFGAFTAATGDIIVVHFDSADCNASGSTNETTAVNEQPAGTHTQNYDTAWDWYTADGGITNTENVLTLYDALGNIMDAVFVTNDPTRATAAGDSENQAAVVAAAGEWEMVGGGIPSGGFVDLDFNAHAAPDLNATGNTAAGESIQRNDDDDNNDKDDWVQAASSFGVRNTGQTSP